MKSDTVPSQCEAFAALESNRRLTSSLLQETAHTTRLTRWIVGLTVAAMLTLLLVAVRSVDPAETWPQALGDTMHSGDQESG
jgi:hypothetical protein